MISVCGQEKWKEFILGLRKGSKEFDKKQQASCKQMAYQVRRLEENEHQRIAELESKRSGNRAAASLK